MKKLALGTNRAMEDVEIMDEPTRGPGHYSPKYDVEMDFKEKSKRFLSKKKQERMKKMASLEDNEAEAEGGDSPINQLVRPRKKNMIKNHTRPLESVGFTNHFFDAVNAKKGRRKMEKEASFVRAFRRTKKSFMKNADNVLPFVGSFVDKKRKERQKDKKR